MTIHVKRMHRVIQPSICMQLHFSQRASLPLLMVCRPRYSGYNPGLWQNRRKKSGKNYLLEWALGGRLSVPMFHRPKLELSILFIGPDPTWCTIFILYDWFCGKPCTILIHCVVDSEAFFCIFASSSCLQIFLILLGGWGALYMILTRNVWSYALKWNLCT